MSKSVAIMEKDEVQKVIPVVFATSQIVKNEPDWDEEAGLTGAIEGRDRNIKRLKPLQYKAISLALQGMTQSQIATELALSRSCVAGWFQKGSLIREIYEDRLHKLWEASVQKTNIIYMKALEVMYNALESPDPKIQQRAASFVLSKVSFSEPFNMEEMSEAERKYSEQRRCFGGQYYAYQPFQRPMKGEIDPEIRGTRSEHDGNCDYSDYGLFSVTESFSLQPYEFDNFCAILDSRELSYEQTQDSIHVLNEYKKTVASFYSYRAEQPSIFHYDSITHSGKQHIGHVLGLWVRNEETELDMGNMNWVTIPRSVPRDKLLDVLEHIVKNPYKET